jgi:nitrogen fixation NifU-like protein
VTAGPTAFRAVVLDHFKHPRNRGALSNATVSIDGANPLCGDRIRIQLLVDDGAVAEARFTADACAICIATASMLTSHVRGMRLEEAAAIDRAWAEAALQGAPPAARQRCVALPVDTLHRAVCAAGDLR